jgi:hypothetical protein
MVKTSLPISVNPLTNTLNLPNIDSMTSEVANPVWSLYITGLSANKLPSSYRSLPSSLAIIIASSEVI